MSGLLDESALPGEESVRITQAVTNDFIDLTI